MQNLRATCPKGKLEFKFFLALNILLTIGYNSVIEPKKCEIFSHCNKQKLSFETMITILNRSHIFHFQQELGLAGIPKVISKFSFF